MKKLLLLTLFLSGGLSVSLPVSAMSKSVMLSCTTYGGAPTASGTACPTSASTVNANAYTSTGFKCCTTKAISDKLNADAATITKNGYTIVKAGGDTSSLTSVDIALKTPYSLEINSDNTCKASGGICALVGACPNGMSAQGSCSTSGYNCCVAPTDPAGGGAGGGATAGNNVQINFENPTKYETVDDFLTGVIGFARNIVVILALVFLVIGGLLYITSAGNEKRIGAAKAAVTAALIGLAIVMVAPSFLKELGTVLGWDNSANLPSDTLSLTEIATNVLNFLLSIIGILAIIMFLVGAVMYFVSAGDEKRANTGKDIVKYAIIGIIVTFSALVLVKQIAGFFT